MIDIDNSSLLRNKVTIEYATRKELSSSARSSRQIDAYYVGIVAKSVHWCLTNDDDSRQYPIIHPVFKFRSTSAVSPHGYIHPLFFKAFPTIHL